MGWISVWRKRNELARRLKAHFAPAELEKTVVGAGFKLVVGSSDRGSRFYPRITITREGWMSRGGVKGGRRGRLVSLVGRGFGW